MSPLRFVVVLLLSLLSLGGCQSPSQKALQDVQAELARRRTAARQALTLTVQAREALDQEQPDRAADLLAQAVAVDPRSAAAWISLGIVACHQGRSDQAAEAFQRAARLAPDRYEPRFNLGCLLEAQRCYRLAIREYRAAQRLAPYQLDVIERLAFCYVKVGIDLEQARQLFQQALARERRSDRLAWLRQQIEQLDRNASGL